MKPNVYPEQLGLVPSFLKDSDPRPASEQFNDRYISGWIPFHGFTMKPNLDLAYPGDPPTRVMAETTLHANTEHPEHIIFYEHAWVAILQSDGSYQVARMD